MNGLAICLMAAGAGAASDFAIACRRDDDRIPVIAEADRTVFEIVSARGIGAASIRRCRPQWPATLVLRPRLRGLEQLQITAGGVTLEVSVSSSPPHAVRQTVSQPDSQRDKTIDRASRFWAKVRILNAAGRPAGGLPDEGGCFELELPAALLDGNPAAIDVRWIDFYRN